MSVVEEIRNDPEKGVKRLECEYKAGLLAVARRFCPDLTDAEALVYRTFSEVVAKIDGYSEQSAFFGWMCKILVNCHAKDVRRKSNSTVFYTDEVPDAVGDDAKSVEEAVDASILRDAIENLPPDMKEAVILRYFMDQPVLKIAQVLALPVGTVKSRLYYARVLLGKRLGANLKKRAVAVAAIAALLLAASAATVAIVSGDGDSREEATREARHSRSSSFSSSSSPFSSSSPSSQSSQESNKEGESEMNATTAIKSAMFAAALGATATASAGNTCTWIGGGSDNKWSTPQNWQGEVVPTDGNGDVVVINNSTANAEIFNDYENIAIASLKFAGSATCVLTGETFKVSGAVSATSSQSIIYNDIIVTGTSEASWNFGPAAGGSLSSAGQCQFYGDITIESTKTIKIGGRATSKFYGSISGASATIVDGAQTWAQGGAVYFYGPLKVAAVKALNNGTMSLPYYFGSSENEWTVLEIGWPHFYCLEEGVLPETTVLGFNTTIQPGTGSGNRILNLYNKNQIIDRIAGPVLPANKDYYYVRSINSSTAEPTRLTLKATADATTYARIQDAISLVYAPAGDCKQTFMDREHLTSGDIIVSNGTFRVAGTSSFANVKRIVVADGATFELATEAANALAGVTNIVLGAGAHFAIAASAVTPFTASAVTLEADSTATFDLPEGADYLFASVVVDGVPLDGDTYSGGVAPFSGTGEVTVPDVERPTVEASWNGNGEDDGIATDGNWAGGAAPALKAGSLLPLFASGGSQALVDRALDFKGLHFGGEAASFSLVSNSPSALLALRQSGIVVDASHTATVDVPMKVKSDQTWTIGAGSTLRLKSHADMTAAYAVTVAGSGATSGSDASERLTSVLQLDEENGFIGNFSVSGARVNVYSTTNAFGPSGDGVVTLGNSQLILHGGVIERPVTLSGQNNKYYWFNVHGTNTFAKPFRQTVGAYWRPYFNINSRTVFEDGATVQCDVFVTGGAGSEIIVRGKPWRHESTSSGVCALECEGSTTVRFEVAGNRPVRLKINGGKAVCGVDDPFVSGTALYMNNAAGRLDLGGHNASFDSLATRSGGTVTSETPGMLKLTAQNAVVTNTAVKFTGEAGFGMSGTGAVFFNAAMESTASLAVSKGRLGFTANGSWCNATNVTVSGTGRLVVAKARTISAAANMAIADSGVVEIPSGVVLRVASLTVDGVTVASGMYGSADSAANKTYQAHFAGSGALAVGRSGFVLIIE